MFIQQEIVNLPLYNMDITLEDLNDNTDDLAIVISLLLEQNLFWHVHHCSVKFSLTGSPDFNRIMLLLNQIHLSNFNIHDQISL